MIPTDPQDDTAAEMTDGPAAMGRLQEVGMAREYYMHGEMTLPTYRFSFDPSTFMRRGKPPQAPSTLHPPRKR